MIYLDSAATTLRKPPSVARACAYAVDHLATPGRGGHRPAMAAAETAFACRREAAALFVVPVPDRVVFTFNATHGLNIAIKTLVKPGSTVLISGYEHNAVTRPLRAIPGVTVKTAESPLFDRAAALEAFRRELTPEVDAVVCTHVSNVFGFILPIEDIAALCRRRGVPLVVDASQSAGGLPLSFRELGAAFIAMPGHKGLLGPQGTGGLSVAPDVTLRPLAVGGSGVHSYDRRHPQDLPEGLEAGTLNAHGLAGLLAGITYIKERGQENLYRQEMKLARTFVNGVRHLPGVTLYGDVDAPHRTAVVSLNLGEEDAGEVADVLAQAFGICTRAGAHCAPLIHEALGTSARGAVRFSFSHLNTPQEVAQAVDAVADLARRLSPI